MIDLKSLIKNGVQFGHQTWRWNPRMAPYIWGEKDGIHLIDVSKTAAQLEKAARFLEATAASGKTILWVGTKKPAAAVIPQVLQQVSCPSVIHRWIGGTITNWTQIKKSLTKKLHLEDIIKKSDESHYTKKELNTYQKLVDRLQKNVGGIQSLSWPVGALIVVDLRKEHVAVREAQAAGIPVVALADTNVDPFGIEYVVPGNDDAPKAIQVVLQYLAEAVQRGQAVAANRPQEDLSASETNIEKLLEGVLGASEEGAGGKPSRQGARRPAAPGRGGPRRSAPGRTARK